MQKNLVLICVYECPIGAKRKNVDQMYGRQSVNIVGSRLGGTKKMNERT